MISAQFIKKKKKVTNLPEPNLQSNFSLEQALKQRRSRRDFSDNPISLNQLSQVLWAAYGITKEPIYKTAPSAGAIYPMTIYVSTCKVKNMENGFYRYIPETHSLKLIDDNNYKKIIYKLGYRQNCLKNPAFTILMAANFNKIENRYGNKAKRYTFMEAGHISQNIYLQVESLGLGTVAVGAFNEASMNKNLPVKAEENIIYIMPIGNLH